MIERKVFAAVLAGARESCWRLVLIALAIGVSSTCPAQETPGAETSIDPYAETVLKKMSDYLGGSEQFSFHGETTDEELLDSGQRLELSASIDVVVHRPNRVWVDQRDNQLHKRIWYDGQRLTVLTASANMYASSPAPPTIDQALDEALDRYGVILPLGDFLYGNPYDTLTSDVEGGFYVGQHIVNGVTCHHLAFTQEIIDWEIWIEDGKQIVPRKISITYKNEPGSPQFTAYLSDWDFASRFPDALFQFVAPPGSLEVVFLEPSTDE